MRRKEKHGTVRIFYALLAIFTALSAIGCKRAKLPDYREGAFCAELRWVSGAVTMCATADVGAPKADGTKRDLTLTFSEPPSMCGIELIRIGGTLTLRRGDMEHECAGAEGWLIGAELLCSQSPDVSITLDKNGSPMLAESAECAVTVIRFQRK